MILGMSLATFTLLHVAISLVGIAAGFVVLYGFLTSKRLPGWTTAFLATTILTDITGYFFPFTKVLPSITSTAFGSPSSSAKRTFSRVPSRTARPAKSSS